MLLSDEEIREAIELGDLVINPAPSNRNIQPVSVDLTLDNSIHVQPNATISGISLDPETLDVARHLEAYTQEEDISGGRSFKFGPGKFVIGQTVETVGNCSDLVGRIGRKLFDICQPERQQRRFTPNLRPSDPWIPSCLNNYNSWPASPLGRASRRQESLGPFGSRRTYHRSQDRSRVPQSHHSGDIQPWAMDHRVNGRDADMHSPVGEVEQTGPTRLRRNIPRPLAHCP